MYWKNELYSLGIPYIKICRGRNEKINRDFRLKRGGRVSNSVSAAAVRWEGGQKQRAVEAWLQRSAKVLSMEFKNPFIWQKKIKWDVIVEGLSSSQIQLFTWIFFWTNDALDLLRKQYHQPIKKMTIYSHLKMGSS